MKQPLILKKNMHRSKHDDLPSSNRDLHMMLSDLKHIPLKKKSDSRKIFQMLPAHRSADYIYVDRTRIPKEKPNGILRQVKHLNFTHF